MPNGLLSVVIGNDKLSYFFLQKRGTRSVFSSYGVIPGKEGTAFSFSLAGIKAVCEEEHISPQKLLVSIFRDDVLTHQLTLPKMAKPEIEEVIQGEIEKIPAFADREFEYVYASHELDDRRVKIIFTAYFTDTLKAIREEAQALKVHLENIELAPLNLLPALYSVNEGNEDALVVVDERSTYVMVVNKKLCRFFYVTSTGLGELFTSRAGVFNALAFSNWTEELKRILKSYAIEYKRNGVGKIWIIWDKDRVPDLDRKLQDEMGIETVVLDPALLFQNNSGLEQLNPFYSLAAASLAARARGLKSEISYEPFMREVKLRKALKKVIVLSIGYLLLLVTLGARVNWEISQRTAKKVSEVRAMEQAIALLENKAVTLRREQSELIKIKTLLLSQAEFVKNINRISWSRVFGEVAAELPAELCLTTFKVWESGQVDIKGEALKIESVAALMRRIEGSRVLDNAKFDSLNEKRMGRTDDKVFTFGIKATLRKVSDAVE